MPLFTSAGAPIYIRILPSFCVASPSMAPSVAPLATPSIGSAYHVRSRGQEVPLVNLVEVWLRFSYDLAVPRPPYCANRTFVL